MIQMHVHYPPQLRTLLDGRIEVGYLREDWKLDMGKEMVMFRFIKIIIPICIMVDVQRQCIYYEKSSQFSRAVQSS